MVNGGSLPKQFTCDGKSQSPPLAWSGAPAGRVGYALAMHHTPGPGDTHWYWVLFDIPATVDHTDASQPGRKGRHEQVCQARHRV
jgi:phosphatidylethanolamine-binding protein (PEBP) family uncharacterized protein